MMMINKEDAHRWEDNGDRALDVGGIQRSTGC